MIYKEESVEYGKLQTIESSSEEDRRQWNKKLQITNHISKKYSSQKYQWHSIRYIVAKELIEAYESMPKTTAVLLKK